MNRFLVLLLLPLTLFCQAQKKVALLEPLADSDSEISSVEKAMIRGELRKAIVRIDDYEAISRTDIDRLLKEQNFQQTGYVRDEDIHRIGEMSGADYLCVSTINKSDTHYYLEVYLVDVQTGSILEPVSQYGQIENGNLDGLYQICQQIIKELIAGKSITSNIPMKETFDENTWGWSVFSRDNKTVQVLSGELRINNYGAFGNARSDVTMPVDINKDFKININIIVDDAKLFSVVGVRFAGQNAVDIHSGSAEYTVGSSKAIVSTIKMGLGRNRPIVMDIIKKDGQVTIIANGAQLCNTACTFLSNQLSIVVGPNTYAKVQDVTITYLR